MWLAGRVRSSAGLQAQPVPQQACGPGPARNGLAGPACTAAGSLARSGLNCGYRAYWPGPLRGRRTGSAQSSALIRVRPAPLRTVTSWPALAMPAHQCAGMPGSSCSGARGQGPPCSGLRESGLSRPEAGRAGPVQPSTSLARPTVHLGGPASPNQSGHACRARPTPSLLPAYCWHTGPARPSPLCGERAGPRQAGPCSMHAGLARPAVGRVGWARHAL